MEASLLEAFASCPRTVPFSRRGAWTCFAALERYQPLGPGLYWRTNHARSFVRRELFRLVLVDGEEEVASCFRLTPDCLEVLPEDGRAGVVRIVYESAHRVRLRGEGIGMRIETRKSGNKLGERANFMMVAQPVGHDRWSVNFRSALRRYGFERLHGELDFRSDWDGERSSFVEFVASPCTDGKWEVAAEEYWSTWKAVPATDFASARTSAGEDFASFAARFPLYPAVDAQARRLALYTLWMNLVTPSGWLKRPAMLMSRNWMDQVWSWDNLFNAAAIAVAHPSLAEDQWRVIFDLQDEHGALPDAVSDTWLHYNFSKPPVQGLLYRWMELQRSGFWTAERKEWFFRHTAAFTDWWLENRRFAGRGLCHYLHGNDSGWDNTTLLREGAPIESPDLNAFLIVQCQLLAQLAEDPRAGERWQNEADGLTRALLAELWDGEAFVGRLPLKDDMAVRADSLVSCMPLVLGDALPAQVRTALLQQVQRLLTPYGPATEAPDSPFYIPDGYWRGPIWGPSTQILVHALHVSGETTLARDVASRFLRLCEKSGFAENFEALTAAPLRDLNYTWTASAFLELAAYVAAPDWQELTPIA